MLNPMSFAQLRRGVFYWNQKAVGIYKYPNKQSNILVNDKCAVDDIRPQFQTATQVRSLHRDLQVPDFTPYRRNSTKDPRKISPAESRNAFTYLVIGAGGIAGIYCAKYSCMAMVLVMAPTADVLALAQIEVKLGEIPEGTSVTIKWRGKPLFVRHRTEQEINDVRSVPLSVLRDPEKDEDRVKDAKWLVCVGICTHLGCVPIANAGDYGGYYCPCHGSHFDISGRVRQGPAPTNMEIPQYDFSDECTLLVG